MCNVTLFCQFDPKCQTDKFNLRSYIYNLYVSSFLLIVSEAEDASLLTEVLISKTEFKAALLHFPNIILSMVLLYGVLLVQMIITLILEMDELL